MALKSPISENDFREILRDYRLGEFTGFKEFAQGAGQSTVLLQTTKGKYVLRYYGNRTEKHILFEVQLLNYLKHKHYPVPGIIRTSHNDLYGRHKDKLYTIIEYIEGEHPKNPNRHFDKEQVSKVVEITARLHTLTGNYEPDYLNNREVFNAGYAWREYQKIKRKIQKQERAKWFKYELNKLDLPETLPKCICHADLNYGNFLFRSGEIAAVLDFDMSFYTYRIYDAADLLYWWTFPPEKGFKENEASFIVNEYLKHHELSVLEKRYIYDALKLIILLGISWSEESDFEDSKKSVEYLNMLGRQGFYKKIFPAL